MINDCPDMRSDLQIVLHDIDLKGDAMLEMSRKFVCDTRDHGLRRNMAEQAKNLLYAVTRLFVLADVIDSDRIAQMARETVATIRSPRIDGSDKKLDQWLCDIQRRTSEIDSLFANRQEDLIDGIEREQIAVLRESANHQLHLLRLSAKLSIAGRNSGCASLRRVHETFGAQLSKLINDLMALCTSTREFKVEMDAKCLDIPAKMNNFIAFVNEEASSPAIPGGNSRQLLESRLEDIVRDVGLVIDSLNGASEDRACIANLCNALRQSLQDIINILEDHSIADKSDLIDRFSRCLQTESSSLLRKTRKILCCRYNDMVDRPDQTALLLEKSLADKKQFKKFSKSFQTRNQSLIEIARLLATFSTEAVHKRCIAIAVDRYSVMSRQLCEVSDAVSSCAQPEAAPRDFWRVLVGYWRRCAHLLMECVDEACRIEDLLCSCDQQMLSAITECLDCVHHWSRQQLGDRIVCRAGRLLSIVRSEMNRYERGEYTDLVNQAVQLLTGEGLPALSAVLNQAGASGDRREELMHATNAIYDAVREIRCAVLMNSALELPSDSEEGYPPDESDETLSTARISSPSVDRTDGVQRSAPGSHECIPREVMRKLPQSEKDQIERQVRVLRHQKRTFDREVLKWDEKGNDIVMLARKMCVIMMEMSDFTRGQGPLRGTMDVINAAQRISDYGVRLDKIARNIAFDCVESQSKQDLLAYLDRVSLFTHQLSITSRVKADVQNISGELIVSGLDSAISLITSAKNLMNAVISVVKASYIASTKYRGRTHTRSRDSTRDNSPSVTTDSQGPNSNVQWHVKPPEKKPLHIVDQGVCAKIKTNC